MATFAAINHRPFSIEANTELMMPDGIFDGALSHQWICCYLKNAKEYSLENVTVYLEGISDAGIIPDHRTIAFETIFKDEIVLVKWLCNFTNSKPGKTRISLRVSAKGEDPIRIFKTIFVSRTEYDISSGNYICHIPEGRLQLHVYETSGAAAKYGPGDTGKVLTTGPWILRSFSKGTDCQYVGQYGPLPFSDPWWKVVGWVIAAVAGIAAILLAKDGKGTAKASIKCDFDEKTGSTSNCGTGDPEPTNGRTETTPAGIASAIASTAIAIGLADDIDPIRRGQALTPVKDGEVTISEHLEVNILPLDDLFAGAASRVRANWSYTRTTNQGVYFASASDEQVNQHQLGMKQLNVPKRSRIDELVPANATLTFPNGTSYAGQQLFVTLLIRPPIGQGGEFRFILEDRNSSGNFKGLIPFPDYVAQLKERKEKYIGVWRIYLIAQDVNLAPEMLAPEIAATIIGGFIIAAPIGVTLTNEICPTFEADSLLEIYE